MKLTSLKLATAVVAVLAAPLGAAGLTSLTTPQELALGQAFAEAVDRRFPLQPDPILNWYVNYRGRQMADISPRGDIPYFFRVIDSGEINAFAIPGGHIYVNLGIFQVAEEEAELLRIVAHELGHIVARHSAEQIVRQRWASISPTSATHSHPNYYAYLAGNLFGELGFLKMSRDAEWEADRLGFQILVDADYDPRGMIRMFEKMLERQAYEPRRLQKLFLTHPPTEERIAHLKALVAATSLPEDLRLSTEEFHEIKRRVDELYPYHPPDDDEDEQSGEEDGDVRSERKRNARRPTQSKAREAVAP